MNCKGIFLHNKDDWETPDNIFNYLDRIFNFTLDPCSNDFNFKCSKHYTIKDNGLLKSWNNEIVFCNPPYGKCIYEWIKKGYEEHIINNVLSVFLVPARTDTDWFHKFVINKADIIFLRGRIKFKGSKSSAPFPSMLIVYHDRPLNYSPILQFRVLNGSDLIDYD